VPIVKPQRIQLSRAKGWRMPDNTIKVDRTGPWGNPFTVSEHGTQAECFYLYGLLLAGWLAITAGNIDQQKRAIKALQDERDAGYPTLRGKNLACWCRIGTPCHADHLLEVVNTQRGRRPTVDLAARLGRYGYRIEKGRPIKMELTPTL
jgi:hypothetical protein